MYDDLEILETKMNTFIYEKRKNEREEWQDFVIDIRKFMDSKKKFAGRRRSQVFTTRVGQKKIKKNKNNLRKEMTVMEKVNYNYKKEEIMKKTMKDLNKAPKAKKLKEKINKKPHRHRGSIQELDLDSNQKHMLLNEIQSDEEIDIIEYYFEKNKDSQKEEKKQKKKLDKDGYPTLD